MANTYGQNYQHIVFAPKYRRAAIDETFREKLQQYITGIVHNRTHHGASPKHEKDRHKMIAIYAMPDHIHILIGFKPWDSLSGLVAIIKQESTNFINEHQLTKHKFEWQSGFGYFSHSHKELDTVANYIHTQPERHKKRTFKQEFMDILRLCEVEFDEKYVFQWIEDI
jgi:putative transposase